MKKIAFAMWNEDQGFLTFEWILLVTLLTIGIVSGVSAVRDATIDELGDVAQAMLSLDQSYTIAHPLGISVHTTSNSAASDSGYNDQFADNFFRHCGRTGFSGQGVHTDCDSQ